MSLLDTFLRSLGLRRTPASGPIVFIPPSGPPRRVPSPPPTTFAVLAVAADAARVDASTLGRLTAAERARLTRAVARRATDAARFATAQLRLGDISLDTWHAGMADSLTATHWAAAQAWLGQRDLDAADAAELGRQIDRQLGFLDRFAAAIRSGEQPLDGTAEARAGLYGSAAWAVAQAVGREAARRDGKGEEKRILGRLDHCRDCLVESGKGWQPIGTLRAIGDSVCRSRCGCRFAFR